MQQEHAVCFVFVLLNTVLTAIALGELLKSTCGIVSNIDCQSQFLIQYLYEGIDDKWIIEMCAYDMQ